VTARPWQTRSVTLRPGDVLGRYQVLCPIGAGGMAEVYAARVVGAEQFAKLVALKVMLPHLSRDPKFARMFVEEARLAGNIESAHVVTTLDLGKDEREGLYQAMELVLGASLRQLLDADEAPLPRGAALSILAELARGLSDAHAARGSDGTPLGLVHRDVSPHNVLVGLDGRTRLSDFGVARAAASVSATESGELKGKLAYSAPEQLKGEVADARSDVFALGVVVWEVLAGRRLFTAENPLALVDMMMTRPIPRLDEVRPELGAPIAELCAAMLVRERDERTITASEAASRLEQLARDAQGSAAREVIGALVRERAGASLTELEKTIRTRAQALPTLPQSAPAAAATTTTSTLSRTLGIAVVVLLVLVLGITVWRGPGDDTDDRGPTNGSTANERTTNERAANEGSTQEASTSATDEAATSSTNEGEGATNEGPTNEGTTNEGPTNEAATRETTAVASGRDEGRRASTGRGDRRGGRAGDDDDAGTPAAAQGLAAPASSETSTSGTRTTMDEPPATTGLLGVEDFDRGGEHAP
jgi:serine/threonine protein kinase